MPTARRVPAANRLLASLPPDDLRRMLAASETVELTFADVLYEPPAALESVYFPTQSLISLIMPVDQHSSLEVGLVGDEGLFGVPLALGVKESPVRAVVQGAGAALRMDATEFCRELRRSDALQRVAALQFAAERGSVHPQDGARALDHRAHRGRLDAQRQRHAEHALIADQADFERRVLVDGHDQRDKALRREIDCLQGLGGLVKHFGEGQLDGFARGQHPAKVIGRQ